MCVFLVAARPTDPAPKFSVSVWDCACAVEIDGRPRANRKSKQQLYSHSLGVVFERAWPFMGVVDRRVCL